MGIVEIVAQMEVSNGGRQGRMGINDSVVNGSIRWIRYDGCSLSTFIEYFDLWRRWCWRGLCMHSQSGRQVCL